MPVAVARKIEHRLYLRNLRELDIQVRPIALTLEQCQHYRLPRTPLKDTERRAAVFEDRYGEGATELDALEALHPGELHGIIEGEVGRYFDSDLADAVNDTATEIEESITEITGEVHAKHRAKNRVEENRFGACSPDRCMAEAGETCLACHNERTASPSARSRPNRVAGAC
jgi:hypothetical protein